MSTVHCPYCPLSVSQICWLAGLMKEGEFQHLVEPNIPLHAEQFFGLKDMCHACPQHSTRLAGSL